VQTVAHWRAGTRLAGQSHGSVSWSVTLTEGDRDLVSWSVTLTEDYIGTWSEGGMMDSLYYEEMFISIKQTRKTIDAKHHRAPFNS